MNSRQSRFVLFAFFVLFFAVFFPSATLTFQENFLKFITSFDSSIPTQQANYPFVRLNVNLGRTLDDLFLWMNKSSSKNRLHRRTNRRTTTQTTKSSENLFAPFSHQMVCLSETICSSSTCSVKTAIVFVIVIETKGFMDN